jgi:exo-beta-1,3-glucanase (GH17 family)
VVALLLLLLIGGGGAGAYFAIRKGNNYLDIGNTAAASDETAELVADNSKGVDINSPPPVRENRFYGLSYSPFGLGDNRVCPPFKEDASGMCLLADQVTADIRQISAITTRIKLYSLGCLNATQAVISYADANDMTVMLGVWFTNSAKTNEKEWQRLDILLQSHAKSRSITHVMLGNEAVFIEKASVADVAAGLLRLRKTLNAAGVSPTVMIGTSEIYSAWLGKTTGTNAGVETAGLDLTPIVKNSDFIGLNSHPYYGGQDPTVANAAKFVVDEAQAIAKKYKAYKVPVYVAETGFPTRGKSNKVGSSSAKPSVAGLTAYAADIEAESRASKLPVCTSPPRLVVNSHVHVSLCW